MKQKPKPNQLRIDEVGKPEMAVQPDPNKIGEHLNVRKDWYENPRDTLDDAEELSPEEFMRLTGNKTTYSKDVLAISPERALRIRDASNLPSAQPTNTAPTQPYSDDPMDNATDNPEEPEELSLAALDEDRLNISDREPLEPSASVTDTDASTNTNVGTEVVVTVTVKEPSQKERDEAKRIAASFRKWGPLKGLNTETLSSQEELFRTLNLNVITNEFDLPVGIYRCDILNYQEVKELLNSESDNVESMQYLYDLMKASALRLDFHNGWAEIINPTTNQQKPFWLQLPHEGNDAYEAFKYYLGLGPGRLLTDVYAWDAQEVAEWQQTYYWESRIKAFDLYRAVVHHQKKVQRMLLAEESHYDMTSKLIKQLDGYFRSVTAEQLVEEMSFDKAVGALEKLVRIQRISVGLTANGESKENLVPRSLPSIQKTQNVVADVANRQNSAEDAAFDETLLDSDPEAVDLAQDLIIRMQQNREQHGNKEH